MIGVIMQPGYLPWLGFFELMSKSDIFIIYDNVQYDKNGWRNRNQIKTPNGPQWLTVPVLIKNKPKINEVKIDNRQNWNKKHLKALELNYKKTSFFDKYYENFEKILLKKWERLLDLDMALIRELNKALGLKKEIKLASSIKINASDKVERLIKICKHFKVNTFYEPAGGKNYLEPKKGEFKKEGIKLIFQNYKHPIYKQLYGEFIPNLSVIDLLFNEGKNSLKIITNQ